MSKQKQVKISKLCLEIGGTKIELTMKQARELSEVLNDTFGKSETVFRDRWHYGYPYPNQYWGSTTGTYSIPCGNITATTVTGANCATTDTVMMSSAEWQGKWDDGLITLTAQ